MEAGKIHFFNSEVSLLFCSWGLLMKECYLILAHFYEPLIFGQIFLCFRGNRVFLFDFSFK